MSSLAEPDADPCLGCARLEAGEQVTQLAASGRTVCTWCPAWREECRERHALVLRILDLPNKFQRQNTVADVEKHQGPLAAERLRAEVISEWNARRGVTGAS